MPRSLITAIEANTTAMQNSAAKLVLLQAVNDQIVTASALGEFTLIVDVSGQQAPDVLYVSDQLVKLKYTTDIGLNQLTVNWGL